MSVSSKLLSKRTVKLLSTKNVKLPSRTPKLLSQRQSLSKLRSTRTKENIVARRGAVGKEIATRRGNAVEREDAADQGVGSDDIKVCTQKEKESSPPKLPVLKASNPVKLQ